MIDYGFYEGFLPRSLELTNIAMKYTANADAISNAKEYVNSSANASSEAYNQ